MLYSVRTELSIATVGTVLNNMVRQVTKRCSQFSDYSTANTTTDTQRRSVIGRHQAEVKLIALELPFEFPDHPLRLHPLIQALLLWQL